MPPRRASRQSKGFIAKRRARAVISIVGSLIALSVIISGASWVSSFDSLTITEVIVRGVDAGVEADALKASALQSLKGKYMGIFSRANTVIYSQDSISDTIIRDFPWVDSVSIEREGAHRIELEVTEREPAALVCTTFPDFNGTDLSLEDPGSCYFADGTGVIFRKAPSFSGNVYRRYYMPDLIADATTTDMIVGTMATSSVGFVGLDEFYLSIAQQGITVDAILVKPDGEYELYARNPASVDHPASTVVVYFNAGSPLQEQATNLVSFWKHMMDKARTNGMPIRFDSIDVRYGANVFYRESK